MHHNSFSFYNNPFSRLQTLLFRVSFVFMILVVQNSLFGQAKIGYINSQKIRKAYSAVKEAEQQLAQENRKWEQALGVFEKDLQTQIRELDEQSLLLSDDLKKEKMDKITDLKKQIQIFQQQKWGDNGEYGKKQESLLKPVYDDIKKAVDEISDEDGLDIVFDTVQGNIVFAKDKFDITERVIELLKKNTTNTKKPER